jgi:SAM-dependent methyltransferase
VNLKQSDISVGFVELVKQIKSPIVFELGTKQSIIGRSTMHKSWVPHSSAFYGIDIESGNDVDLVADLHNFSSILNGQDKLPKTCDVVISCSTFEHILEPFKAASEISKIMNPGGLLFIQTHNCFPLHAYPCDYWRYSIESLSYVMCQAGLEVIDVAYTFPAVISSVQEPTVSKHPAFLLVSGYARKTKCLQ